MRPAWSEASTPCGRARLTPGGKPISLKRAGKSGRPLDLRIAEPLYHQPREGTLARWADFCPARNAWPVRRQSHQSCADEWIQETCRRGHEIALFGKPSYAHTAHSGTRNE